ncbi:MAG TPA: hypothetical protein ENI29_05670 [bacterium]|nr:hypothetical protein [bacterium]
MSLYFFSKILWYNKTSARTAPVKADCNLEIYLVDIINAGISAGYKFKIRSAPMVRYLIRLDVD